MDKWTKDVEILNDVVDWIGYEKCRFKEIVHENDGGYATDNKTDLSVGDECAEKFKVVLKEWVNNWNKLSCKNWKLFEVVNSKIFS